MYTEKLYFGDAKMHYIAMSDLEGRNRRLVMNEGVNHIYSLAVYGNSLYWSDWGENNIHRAHKYTGASHKVLAHLIHRPMGEI